MRVQIERLVGLAVRRPGATIAVVLITAIAGGLLALGLKPSTGTDTFVSRSAASFKATDNDHRAFGSDAVIILIKEPLTNLVQTSDLGTLTELEACIAGQQVVKNFKLQAFTPVSSGARPYGGWGSPCGKLMRDRPVEAVYGPGTFLNRAVAAVNTEIGSLLAAAQQKILAAEQEAYALAIGRGLSAKQARTAARAAGQLVYEQQYTQLATTYLQSGMNGTPSIQDPQFIPQIVFDQSRGVNQPKARFAYLFPTADSALIQVRLKGSLSDTQQAAAISWIRQAVQMPMFRSQYGGSYTVTGAPVVVNDLASQITSSIGVLLIAAVLAMALTLWIVFRGRPRLLPLAVALAAAAVTFGLTRVIGAGLTMASIAVLPILIGLAVDYAIQFQSRAQEAHALGGDEQAVRAVRRAAVDGAPTITIAALATATGFLVLLLSPVPMVRGFGLLLVVGIAIALLCALTAGAAAIVLAERDGGALRAALRGAADIVRDGAAHARRSAAGTKLASLRVARPTPAGGGPPPRLIARVISHPERVIALAVVLAAAGWVADTQTSVQSDVTKLVPASMPALRNLHTLERITGVSGEIDVTVRAKNVATVPTVRWMIAYEQSLLARYGYLETKGCAQATLCPALSLPDLFSRAAQSGSVESASLTQPQIDGLLSSVPQYFRQAVLSPDNHEAVLAFGIRLMPLGRQQQVISYMRSQLHPPPGVSAQLAGLPVLAAEANAALSSSPRRLLTLLAGLIAVGLVLVAVFRTLERAIVPLIPIALATGWSALILFATQIPLNPMSATLGALVIAISTEFSVLLSERFRQEREAGHELTEALARTYRSTGAAVRASGITAIVGFGVLVFSNITMLRDFGFVTVIDLSVSLTGVLLVLPAVLVLAERRDALQGVGSLALRAPRALPRLRRRARVA